MPGITIHQTLHGYADGHRLLKTSIKLPPEPARAMLVLSDLSGAGALKGFETYLTGYPLFDSGYYVLAKTWYAAEMERPGCVWTHSLLISVEGLLQATHMSILLKLFKRPEEGKQFDEYQRPMGWPSDSTRTELAPSVPHLDEDRWTKVVPELIKQLYSEEATPIYLAAEDSKIFERLFLRVWSQQWYELRSTFSFCTGSLSSRRLNSRHLDLQLIPVAALRKIQRESKDGRFIDATKVMGAIEEQPSWVCAASADLVGVGSNGLNEFLRRYGVGTTKQRHNFAKLVRIHEALRALTSESITLRQLIGHFIKTFPGKESAAELKQDVLSKNGVISSVVSEAEIIGELAQTKSYDSFDLGRLDLYERAKALPRTYHTEAIKLIRRLLGSQLTEAGELVLKGIVEALEIPDILAATHSQTRRLLAVFKFRPDVAAEPEIWRLPLEIQHEVFASLEINRSGDVLKSAVKAMLDARSELIPKLLRGRDHWNEIASILLSWLNNQPVADLMSLNSDFRGALRERQKEILEWLEQSKLGISTLAFLTNLLDPRSQSIVQRGAVGWIPLAQVEDRQVTEAGLLTVKAFLLAVGFRSPETYGATLVSSSFQSVYDAAEKGHLEARHWEWVKDYAPTVRWWGDWDQCERLRHALIAHFADKRWGVDEFFRAIKRADTFDLVLDACESSGWRRRFIRNVAMQALREGSAASEWQREMLRLVTV